MNIKRTKEYLDYGLNLSQKEIDLRDRLMNWLPDSLIDAHAHCNLWEHVIGLSDRVNNHMMSTFPYFSLEDSYETQEILYPGKKVRTLRFCFPFLGIDHKSANDYLLKNSPAEDRVALYGIPTDIEYTIKMLVHPRVCALKMYYFYFDPPATSIYEYFPQEVLAVAQEKEIPIILHLPRMITMCSDELQHVLKNFPNLKIILAHLGLPHLLVPGLAETYEHFAQNRNIAMDTAMIPSVEVIILALRSFGPERIIFGSDQPLSLIRSVVYQHPTKGQRISVNYPYHWVDYEDQITYGNLAKDATQVHWQSINAIKRALKEFSTREGVLKKFIFEENARRVFNFT